MSKMVCNYSPFEIDDGLKYRINTALVTAL